MSDAVEFFPNLKKGIFHVQLMATRLIRITLGDEMYGSNIEVFLNKFGVFTVSMGFMTSPMINATCIGMKQWILDDYPSIHSTYECLLLGCKLQDGKVICGCGTSCGSGTDGVFKHLLIHMPPTDKSASTETVAGNPKQKTNEMILCEMVSKRALDIDLQSITRIHPPVYPTIRSVARYLLYCKVVDQDLNHRSGRPFCEADSPEWRITVSHNILRDPDLAYIPKLVAGVLRQADNNSQVIIDLSHNGFKCRSSVALRALRKLLDHRRVSAVIVHHTPIGTIRSKYLINNLLDITDKLIWISEPLVNDPCWHVVLDNNEPLIDKVRAAHSAFYAGHPTDKYALSRRHGEGEHNVKHDLTILDPELTKVGVEQSRTSDKSVDP